MAWPTTDTWDINDVSTNTHRAIIPTLNNLIKQGQWEILRIANARGAIEEFTGGDRWRTTAIIDGGTDDIEYDPADENPTATVTLTSEQTTAPIDWKVWARTVSVNWSQSLTPLNSGVGKVADVLRAKFLAKSMVMLENFAGNATSSGGRSAFWGTTGRTVGEGIVTAYSMFADKTSDFALVDVSSKTFWKPQIVTTTSASGANLLKKDMLKLLNACRRGAEGFITDLITTQDVFEHYASQMITQGVVTERPTTVNFGTGMSVPFAEAELSWTRFLSQSAFWNVSSATAAVYPVFGIDFNSVRLRLRRGQAMDPRTGEVALIEQMSPPYIQQSNLRWAQRLGLHGQWYFRGPRRTSGYLNGLTSLA